MRKFYLFPNIITAFGLSCGLFVIFKMALLPQQAANLVQTFQTCAILLLLAGLADLLDGAIARLIHAESEFGVQFDSLADTVSFGIVPSVMMLKSLPLLEERFLTMGMTTAALVYSICGVLRLARFNVLAQQVKVHQNEEQLLAHKKNFVGLPIPAAAAAAVSMNLFLLSHPFTEWFGWEVSHPLHAGILIGVMLLLGFFMVSNWKFPSAKMLHLRLDSFRFVFLTVLCAVLLFYGILYHFPLTMFFFSWAYVLVSLLLSSIRIIMGKRAQTLEDFEPATEDFH